jgi:hypothetical protein
MRQEMSATLFLASCLLCAQSFQLVFNKSISLHHDLELVRFKSLWFHHISSWQQPKALLKNREDFLICHNNKMYWYDGHSLQHLFSKGWSCLAEKQSLRIIYGENAFVLSFGNDVNRENTESVPTIYRVA